MKYLIKKILKEELLIEVSIESLKKQFVETNRIDIKTFDEIVSVTNGKSSYITWLVVRIINGLIKPEDLYKYKKYLNVFSRRKKEYMSSDINQYKTRREIGQFIHKSVTLLNLEKKDISQQVGIPSSEKYKKFYLGSVRGFNVYEIPKGRTDLYSMSCELGSGTEWCTATGKTKKHFNQYISRGPLFLFMKPGSSEKYQFSYETNDFMDKNDNTILGQDITYANDFFDFIESKRPNYKPTYRVRVTMNPNYFVDSGITHIEGDLYLDGTGIKSLGKLQHVGGSLSLTNTKLNSLGNLQHVGGFLSLEGTPLSELYSERQIRNMVDIVGRLYIY